ERILHAGDGERVLPGVEAELLPDEVEAPHRVVEGEDDDYRNREQQVDQREPRVCVEQPVEAALSHCGHARSPSVPSSASVPAMRAQMTTMISMKAIRRNDRAAAV